MAAGRCWRLTAKCACCGSDGTEVDFAVSGAGGFVRMSDRYVAGDHGQRDVGARHRTGPRANISASRRFPLKARMLCLLALAPALLQAQIVLYSLDGITPSPLGAVYGYGQVAAGDSKIVRFRALNTGTASITITLLKVINNTGAGFSIVNSSSTPFVVAPGNAMDFFAGFSATAVTSYSATLQVGTASQTVTAILLATVVPAPTLSVAAPCTGPDANATISFGRILAGDAGVVHALDPESVPASAHGFAVDCKRSRVQHHYRQRGHDCGRAIFFLHDPIRPGHCDCILRDTHRGNANLHAIRHGILVAAAGAGLELRHHRDIKRRTAHPERAAFRTGTGVGRRDR